MMFGNVLRSLCVIGVAAVSVNTSSECYINTHPEWDNFNAFINTYDKHYDETTIQHHFDNYLNNIRIIAEHGVSGQNTAHEINKYGDLNPAEFKDAVRQGCYKNQFVSAEDSICDKFVPHLGHGAGSGALGAATYIADVIGSRSFLDWRDFGVVSPVKNQGKCGSCWSFSATGALEGAWMLHTGTQISLSEQQLIDCSTSFGDNGCNGGMMDDAFGYAIEYGMCTEENDPYEAKEGTCTECVVSTHFETCYDVEPNNEVALLAALHNGPVSVAIEADQAAFQFYKNGIIDTPTCGTALDHGVLLVGFGTDVVGGKSKDYWLVKNSWGADWGEDGYVRIARNTSGVGGNSSGMCGIAAQPSFPVVKSKPYNHIQTTCHCYVNG